MFHELFFCRTILSRDMFELHVSVTLRLVQVFVDLI